MPILQNLQKMEPHIESVWAVPRQPWQQLLQQFFDDEALSVMEKH